MNITNINMRINNSIYCPSCGLISDKRIRIYRQSKFSYINIKHPSDDGSGKAIYPIPIYIICYCSTCNYEWKVEDWI